MAGSRGSLWVDVDRIALCVHRPTARQPELRKMVERLQLPSNSFFVVAARHLVSGSVSTSQLEVLSRYESRTLVQLNLRAACRARADRNRRARRLRALGGPQGSEPTGSQPPKCDRNRAVAGQQEPRAGTTLALQIVDQAQRSARVPTPAFDVHR